MSFTPVPHDCRAFLGDFSAFIDGELPAGKRAEYQAHVDCCQSCLAHLAAYRRGITVLRSLEESAPVDLWTRLERRLWLGPALSVVDGDADRAAGRTRWSRPAVSLAAAAVLALFFLVRGMGPGTTPTEVGPRMVSASVGMTVPQVPPAGQAALAGAATGAATSRVTRGSRGAAVVPAEDPATPALARAQTVPVFERELDSLRAEAFRQTLGRTVETRPTADGWVQPVRLGNSWSRATIVPATLVRPAAAVRPAPWNVDRAVSLP